MNNNVVEILKSVVGELREVAKSQSIIGEPITVGGRTVIPVVKLSVGFGAGGGQGQTQKATGGFGGGGGGGALIEPVAFIIIDKDDIRLLPAKKGKWEDLIEAVPGVVTKLAALKDKLKTDKTEKSGSE